MPKNDIGGFFVSLGLNIDRDSFETGNKLIDGVGNSFNKLIGSARNAAVVLAGTAIATGSVESAAYKMSQKLNISTESLDLWKASAKIAGVDANGLIGAMGRMANVIDHMKIDGTGLEEFTKQLGKLGIITDEVDIAKMLDMAPDELMTVIIQKAQEASAQAKRDIAEAKKALEVNPNDTQAQTKLANAEDVKRQAQVIVGDILGDEGKGLFIELERQGRSIDELKSLASKTIFTDRQTNESSQDFMEQVRVTKTLSENITKLLGSDIGKALTPALTELNAWLIGHGDDIKNAMSSLAGAIEKIVGKTVDFLTDEDVQETAKTIGSAIVDSTKGAIETTKDVSTKLVGGDLPGAGKALIEGAGKTIAEPVEKIVTIATKDNETVQTYKEETGQSTTTAAINTGARSIPILKWVVHGTDYLMNKTGLMSDEEYAANTAVVTQPKKEKKKKNKINDGIMRPDGTVTQVAPDDWVLAARNLGDLAKAFVPESEPRPVTEPVQNNVVPAYKPEPTIKEEPKAAPIVINLETNAPKEIPVTEPKQVTPQIINEIQIVEPQTEKTSPVQDTIVNIPEQQVQIIEPRETQNQEQAPIVMQSEKEKQIIESHETIKEPQVQSPVVSAMKEYSPTKLDQEQPRAVTQDQPQIVVTEGKEKALPATMPTIQVMPEINVISPQEQKKQDFIPPAENEAPRLYEKDEPPINNFVYQKQPQPQITTDWSIVAKTVSDLARSFIQPQPQTVQQSAGEYTINQTFNISGGNDMPQVLKQQAYHGTQEGLLELMQQSSQRLQLMSGTR